MSKEKKTIKKLPEKKGHPLTALSDIISKRSTFFAFLIGLVLSFWLGLWISPILKFSIQQYRVGEYTTRAIRAPTDIVILDEEATNKRIEDAIKSVFPVYDYDPDLQSLNAKKVHDAFEQMRALFKLPEPEDYEDESPEEPESIPVIPKEVLAEAEARFLKVLGITLSDKELKALEESRFGVEIEQEILKLLADAYSKSGLVWSIKSLEETLPDGDREKGVVLRNVKTGEEKVITDLSAFIDIELASRNIDYAMLELSASGELEKAVANIAKQLLRPNLSYNLSETEKRREIAAKSVQKVVYRYAKNQLIIGEGQPITKETLNILSEIRRSQIGQKPLFTYLITSLGIYFILITLYLSSRRVLAGFRPSVKDIGFVATMLGSVAFASWVWSAVADSLSERFSIFEGAGNEALAYVMPVSAFAMLVGMIMPVGVAFVFSILAATFAGIVLGGGLAPALTFLIGSIFGITDVRNATTRSQLLKSGLLVGVIQGVVAILLSFIIGRYQHTEPAGNLSLFSAGGLLGGILAGPVCVATAPIVEFLFSYSTGVKLLELTSLNHPLLKELIVKAPGTYQHSTMVASLAEAGAESIGANALLAKVASMYHDVGKMSMPQYFIENFSDQSDLHERLMPNLSAKIIMSHVREGVELAKTFKLGQPISDIIAQHHGTSLVRFFYHKAKEVFDPQKERVEEIDFRYPGPKPQTKEAAIVMMADVVEAATRTLKNPSYARIQETVKELIQNIVQDGQLDECNITFKQLSSIEDAFTRLLVATFHQRVEYPEVNGEKNGNNRQAKANKVQEKQSQKADEGFG